jgi:hypothetical protein
MRIETESAFALLSLNGIAHKIFTAEERADILDHFGPRRLAAPRSPLLLEGGLIGGSLTAGSTGSGVSGRE